MARGVLLCVMGVVAGLAWLSSFGAGGEGGGNAADALYPKVREYLAARAGEFDQIEPDRREVLDQFATFIREQNAKGQTPKLVFICTHNSRRSHMGQIWAAAAGRMCGVRVATYSGGTEVTKFNPRAVAALERAGLKIEQTTQDDDPVYHVKVGEGVPAITCFSKKYSDPPNPTHDFAAIMTCDQADAQCPVVQGAIARFHTGYVDPKAADGTKDEQKAYDERCAQIAREMLYVMKSAAK